MATLNSGISRPPKPMLRRNGSGTSDQRRQGHGDRDAAEDHRRPAVAIARRTASSLSSAARTLLAPAGDHQQRVVDGDAEPDEGNQVLDDERHVGQVTVSPRRARKVPRIDTAATSSGNPGQQRAEDEGQHDERAEPPRSTSASTDRSPSRRPRTADAKPVSSTSAPPSRASWTTRSSRGSDRGVRVGPGRDRRVDHHRRQCHRRRARAPRRRVSLASRPGCRARPRPARGTTSSIAVRRPRPAPRPAAGRRRHRHRSARRSRVGLVRRLARAARSRSRAGPRPGERPARRPRRRQPGQRDPEAVPQHPVGQCGHARRNLRRRFASPFARHGTGPRPVCRAPQAEGRTRP